MSLPKFDAHAAIKNDDGTLMTLRCEACGEPEFLRDAATQLCRDCWRVVVLAPATQKGTPDGR